MDDITKGTAVFRNNWSKDPFYFVDNTSKYRSIEEFAFEALKDPEEINSCISWYYASKELEKAGVLISEQAFCEAGGHDVRDGFEEEDIEGKEEEIYRESKLLIEILKHITKPIKVDLEKFM